MIHPTAIVDPSAEIAEGVSIGAFSVIGPGVRLGADTRIGPHVVIGCNTTLGSHCEVFQFASVGEAPQDLSYRGEPTSLVIGDRTVIREGVTMSRGTVKGGGVTRIGSDGLFMAQVHIAHDCEVGDGVVFSNAASLAGHCCVADQATLGGFTLVHQFSRIGRQAFTGMGSALNRDLPPYCLASGNYARAVGINKIGLRRSGMAAEVIQALQQAFRHLVRNRGRGEGLDRVEALAAMYPEVAEFLAFVRSSQRGIIRTGRQQQREE